MGVVELRDAERIGGEKVADRGCLGLPVAMADGSVTLAASRSNQ
jgi:hypothetical protein